MANQDSESKLAGMIVLVVEDEFLIAIDIAVTLEALGARILGPVAALGQALDLLKAKPPPDLAVLDIGLGGENAFDLADALAARGIPFLFATGYDANAMPVRFAHVPRSEKPFILKDFAKAVANLVGNVNLHPISGPV